MAGEPSVTMTGNLTTDPELRFTATGIAVCNFTVASTPRTRDAQTGEWKDGQPLFLRCNVWQTFGEHVAESLTRGARVSVQGRLKQRSFQTKEGEKRTVLELEVDEIGPSLRYATVQVTKTTKSSRPVAETAPTAGSAPMATDPAGDDPWGGVPSQELVGAGAGAGDAPF